MASIPEQTEQEQGPIIKDITDVLSFAETFSSRVKSRGEGVYEFDMFFLRVYHHQLRILYTVLGQIVAGRYVEAFILLRSVFENYFLTVLMSKGTKYVERHTVKGDTEEDRRKLVQKLKEEISQGGYKDIERVDNVGPGSEWVDLARVGLPPDKGEGPTVPYYYFIFQEYDPERLVQIQPFVEGFFADDETEKKWREHHIRLYRRFLTFERIRKALKLNGLLDQKLDARVLVHYGFLSSFVHLTDAGMRRISGNVIISTVRSLKELERYNPQLSELSLLYIIHLLSMYLRFLLEHCKSRGLDVIGDDEVESRIQILEVKYRHFWFIFNDPIEVDKKRFEALNYYREAQGKPKLTEIRYYSDPVERLEQIHGARLCPIHNVRRAP